MSLNLSPEIESVVRERAAAEGMSVNDLLARTFARDREATQVASNAQDRVRKLLARWQVDENSPILPPIPVRPGETPAQALFREWEDENAGLTQEERQAEEQLWKDFQEGIDAERSAAGMRILF